MLELGGWQTQKRTAGDESLAAMGRGDCMRRYWAAGPATPGRLFLSLPSGGRGSQGRMRWLLLLPPPSLARRAAGAAAWERYEEDVPSSERSSRRAGAQSQAVV